MEVYMAVLIGVPGMLALILTLVCFLLLTGCKEAYDTGQPHTAVGVTPADLQLLEEFLSNKIIHDSGQRGETPLRDRIPRIQELLGVRSR